jgi:group I intron endonuclease
MRRLPRFVGIYAITNRINGRVYVGKASKNVHKRWTAHRGALNSNRHHCTLLQSDWNMYGPETFEFTLIESVPEQPFLQQLCAREAIHYRRYAETHKMYNSYEPLPGVVLTDFDY